MYSTKSILPKTVIFAAKLTHHEEISKSSPENITKFTNPLDSNIDSGNDNFTFKEDTNQPDRLEFLEAVKK